MKKSVSLIFVLFATIPFAFAACNLDAVLINQDPYPAIPGSYVKVVFQLTGIENPECKKVSFELKESYPFSLDPEATNKVEVIAGTYVKDYNPYLLIPYQIRVDKEALQGENPIKVLYNTIGSEKPLSIEKEFNITIEDEKVDFEVHIKDYKKETDTFTLEIINIGESDVEGLTVEIVGQENFKLLGPERTIVGKVNSNEEETATFKGLPKEGEINFEIIYTDQIGVRRTIEKSVIFNPKNFPGEKKKSTISSGNSFILGLLIPIVGYFIYIKLKKRKEKQRRELIKRHHGL